MAERNRMTVDRNLAKTRVGPIFGPVCPETEVELPRKSVQEGYKSSTYTYGVAHAKLRPLQLKSLQSDTYTLRYGLLKPAPLANFDRP